MDETAATPPAPRTIGARLRAGRERAGLSVAAAAEKLHLDNKVIESLEADRFADLGASVYVRGHLRRYADFVGEAGAEMVASYTAREARPPSPDLTQIPHAERRSDPRRLVTPVVGLSCALVLIAAIWWVLAGSNAGGDSSSGPTAPVGPTAVVQSATAPEAMPTPVEATANPATVPAGGSPGARNQAVVPADAAQQRREAGPETSPAPVRTTRLRLVLANESWVEIYDARGERLFYDVATAGSVQSVEGRAPLRVVLGNSGGVAVEVDGRSREIPANAADGEGARFVVNRSGSLARSR
jgi:cytoskeleton protein RodZ